MIEYILSAIEKCKQPNPVKETIHHYAADEKANSEANEFLVMIKPECLSSESADLQSVLSMVMSKFSQYDVTVHASYAMNGTYMKANKVMEDQYKMLNRGAHEGLAALPPEIRTAVEKEFDGLKVIGAYPFLQENTDITSSQLEDLSHKKGSLKKGNGTYLFPFRQRNAVVVNAFHPHQIEHCNSPESIMIIFMCSSECSYTAITQDMIGFFNPAIAGKESLRYYIYKNEKKLGLRDIGIFFNGFHVSPSPLEGMFAVLRYGTDQDGNRLTPSDTMLGSRLLKHGYTEKELRVMSKNPYIKISGALKTLFDMAEESDQMSFLFTQANSLREDLAFYVRA